MRPFFLSRDRSVRLGVGCSKGLHENFYVENTEPWDAGKMSIVPNPTRRQARGQAHLYRVICALFGQKQHGEGWRRRGGQAHVLSIGPSPSPSFANLVMEDTINAECEPRVRQDAKMLQLRFLLVMPDSPARRPKIKKDARIHPRHIIGCSRRSFFSPSLFLLEK